MVSACCQEPPRRANTYAWLRGLAGHADWGERVAVDGDRRGLDGAGYSSGTQKVSAAGTTVACNRLLEPRSPQSSSYASGSANLTSITRP